MPVGLNLRAPLACATVLGTLFAFKLLADHKPFHEYPGMEYSLGSIPLPPGWDRETDQIVFAHTHQALDGVTAPGGTVRYWNTGSWIYEPELSSRAGYLAYLRNGWPGTAVLIDSEEPQPRLLRLREHLNPLHQMS